MSLSRRRLLLLAAVAAGPLLLGACTADDDDPTAEATSTLSPASSPSATPTTEPPPTETPPWREQELGLWLIDLNAGEVLSLWEDPGDTAYPITRGFSRDGDGVWVWDRGSSWVRYDLEGEEMERTTAFPPDSPHGHTCEQPDRALVRSVVNGVEHEVNCGIFSPDGRFMLYEVNVDSPGDPMGRYEAWTLNVESGERTLVSDQLRHCGGCDGRVGPAWSPSGRYALVGETYGGPDSTMYLHDTETRDTRAVATGSYVSGLGSNIRWSPTADAYIAPSDRGSFIERLPSGERVALADLSWPARFDDTGELAYSPGGQYTLSEDGWSAGPREETVIASARTGEVLERWTGAPELWPMERGVSWVSEAGTGVAALLERVPGCEGTTVHHPSLPEGRCLEGARGTVFSPDGARVAFGRPVPLDPSWARWEIVVSGVDGADESVLASYEAHPDEMPPLIRWHPEGGLILVLWPGPSGI